MPDNFPVSQSVQRTTPHVKRWRAGFSKVLASTWDPLEWTLIGAIGAGMSLNQAAGVGNLVTGTTANAETIVRAQFAGIGPQQARLWAQIPTRQANQAFYIELVDVIGDALAFTVLSATSVQVTLPGSPFTADNIGQSVTLGAVSGTAIIPGRYPIAAVSGNLVTFTVTSGPASGAGTCSLFGWNFARLTYDGATATNAKFDTARNGWASGDSTVTINTTASPGHAVKLAVLDNFALLFDKLTASSTGNQFTQRGSRERNLPDEDATLWLQIRVLNGASAPAASTTLTVDSLAIEDVEVQAVDVTASQGAGLGPAVNALQNGTWTVQPGNTSNTSAWLFSLNTRTTGAPTRAKVKTAAGTNATSVKTSSGNWYGVYLTNNSAAVKYLKLYSKTTAPTVGTDTPVATFAIPANGGVLHLSNPLGLFSDATGLAYAITGGVAETDTTATAVDDVTGFLAYV
jgi:hypothetical protein